MKKAALVAATAVIVGMTFALPVGAAEKATSTKKSVDSSYRVTAKGHATLRGTVSAISGTTMTVLADGRSWVVNLIDKTRVLARHEHRITLANIKIGDKVMIQGSVASSTASSTISAKLIQDLSLNEKKAVVRGIISNLNAAAHTFTLTLKNGTAVNVTFSTSTVVKTTPNATTSLESLTNGTTVNVTGLLNRTDNSLIGSAIHLTARSTSH